MLRLRPALRGYPGQRAQRVGAAFGLVNLAHANFLRAQLGCAARREAVREHHAVALRHQQVRHGLVPGIEQALARTARGKQATAAMQRYNSPLR